MVVNGNIRYMIDTPYSSLNRKLTVSEKRRSSKPLQYYKEGNEWKKYLQTDDDGDMYDTRTGLPPTAQLLFDIDNEERAAKGKQVLKHIPEKMEKRVQKSMNKWGNKTKPNIH